MSAGGDAGRLARPEPAPLVVVGDALLDRDLDGRVDRLCPDAPAPVVDAAVDRPRPGGAALAAVMAAGDGRPVTLVTALGADAAGEELRGLLEAGGVEVVDLGLEGTTPEKVRVLGDGQVLLRLDRGDGAPSGAVTPAARAAIGWAGAVLVSDYGRGVAAIPALRELLERHAEQRPLVWDPHPKGPEPVRGAWLVTPNRAEAARVVGEGAAGRDDDRAASAAAMAAVLRDRWGARHVAVTLSADGAVLDDGHRVPAPPAEGGDPCGAGDRFAGVVAGELAGGTGVAAALEEGVRRASAFVAAGGASAWRNAALAGSTATGGALAVVQRTRAAGGTVVATGGCFDLLHAGHVELLRKARALGDCLVVCVNTDASVRRLKGETRPLVRQDDRAAVLEALASVDAVALFDEDTPEAVLTELRPDLWVKGGDYDPEALPEAAALRSWGGRAVTVPLVQGRSTSSIVQEVLRRAHA